MFFSQFFGHKQTLPDNIARIRIAIVGSKGTITKARHPPTVPHFFLNRPSSPPLHPPPPTHPTGCGKTSLAHLIAEGTPILSPTPTPGCTVHLVLFTYPHDRAQQQGATPLAGKEVFIELWDVSGASRYEPIRPIYYQGLNGVLLVHDLSSSNTAQHHHSSSSSTNTITNNNNNNCNTISVPSLRRWASEVSIKGRDWQAPLPEERAALSLCGLPVPCLVVGNKADLVPRYRQKYRIGLVEEMMMAVRGRVEAIQSRILALLPTWLGGISGGYNSNNSYYYSNKAGTNNNSSRTISNATFPPSPFSSSPSSSNSPSGHHHPRHDSDVLLHGNIQACALRGDIDTRAINDFFCQLIERQFFPCANNNRGQSLGEAVNSSTGGSFLSAGISNSGTFSHLDEKLPGVMYRTIPEEPTPKGGSSGGGDRGGYRGVNPFAPSPVKGGGLTGRIDDLL